MPELPEVEIVTRNLIQMFGPGAVIRNWVFKRSDLRFKIPTRELLRLKGVRIRKIERRAKFILIYVGDKIIISHLGMTGAWRPFDAEAEQALTHDHVYLELQDGRSFVYTDPRRFGFIEVIDESDLEVKFKNYGFEPLHLDLKEQDVLIQRYKSLQTSIKVSLMNQKYLVGIGNIYASEILFRAGVSPLKKCSKLTTKEYRGIFKYTKIILSAAIESGGSTIENYRNSFGQKGEFQNSFFVYDREGESCLICHTPVRQKMISGRSTYWCPNCQN